MKVSPQTSQIPKLARKYWLILPLSVRTSELVSFAAGRWELDPQRGEDEGGAGQDPPHSVKLLSLRLSLVPLLYFRVRN